MAEEGESPAASLAEVTGGRGNWGLPLPLGLSLGRSGAGRSVTEGASGGERLLAPRRLLLGRRVPEGGSSGAGPAGGRAGRGGRRENPAHL